MVHPQKLKSLSTLKTAAVESTGDTGKSNTKNTLGAKPIDPTELSPLQRQRLDTAVMMLVNYLVSASSEA